ncbi:hypothetical protein ACFWIO_03965 [Streptomyces diastatochromogenes]|uniref:hypothetical protein n=1 Tax=Streptomyces diastatochromogenes TaxID=42236 RepID=UPI00366406AE
MLAPAAQASGYGCSGTARGDCLQQFALEKCIQAVDTATCSSYSQAGPVSISAAGRCILIYGRIDWAGNTGGAFDIGHCG